MDKSKSTLNANPHKYPLALNIFRAVMVIIGCIFFIWFLLPFLVYGIFIPYNMLGMLMSIFTVGFFGAMPLFARLKNKFYQKKPTKFLWQAVRLLIYVFIAYAVVISGIMIVCANIAPAKDASAIMLGTQVRGRNPSLILYDRIMAGKDYLDDNPNAICVATGGLGDTAEITEAECMCNVLTENGIDESRIFLEEKATNTKENILYSYNIIKEQGANENIAIVSDGFHQARARLIARKLGINGSIGAVSADTNWILLPTYWVREWFGLPYDFLFR